MSDKKVYWHRVETAKRTLYDGPDSADAMAAWSDAITRRLEYVTLESLRSPDEQFRSNGDGEERPAESRTARK